MNNKLIVILILASIVFAWDYRYHGDDWNLGLCTLDHHQSPINIITDNISSNQKHIYLNFKYSDVLKDLKFEEEESKELFIDNETHPMGRLEVKGLVPGVTLQYSLVNIHFHSASEHTIDGKYYSIEMHMVHTLDEKFYPLIDRTKLVIAILFKNQGPDADPNVLLDEFNLDTLKPITEMDVSLNQYLKGTNQIFYHYKGSLTTPTCDEAVNWFILKEIQECNQDQFDTITSIIEDNYRYTKNLNDREVYLTAKPLKEQVITNEEKKQKLKQALKEELLANKEKKENVKQILNEQVLTTEEKKEKLKQLLKEQLLERKALKQETQVKV